MLVKPDFLFQFPIQCLLGRLVTPHAALRKLPSTTPGAATQEHLPIVSDQYDSHVGTKSLRVDEIGHGDTICELWGIVPQAITHNNRSPTTLISFPRQGTSPKCVRDAILASLIEHLDVSETRDCGLRVVARDPQPPPRTRT
jgi:hypothetical protein